MNAAPASFAVAARPGPPPAVTAGPDETVWLQRTALYREFLAEREEILRLKWIESEKAGRDIGFESALTEWVVRHRAHWRKARRHGRSAPTG
jgi:hypothetical protein